MYPALNKPSISIVICNYNYAHYIQQAIDSAINQDYAAYEVIVVDDGSTDDSLSIIQTYSDQIKLIQKSNGGQMSAYNEAMQHVTGEVVLFLDSDDALRSNALSQIADKFTKDVVKVHFRLTFMDQEGQILEQTIPRTLDNGDCGRDLIKHGKLYNSAPASGNAYRTDSLKKLFPLPLLTGDKHGADFYCIYGIALDGLVKSIASPLALYRVHIGGASENIAYGNSLKGLDLAHTLNKRWQVFRAWVQDIGLVEHPLPDHFIDFSQQKLLYSDAMLNVTGLKSWFAALSNYLPNLIKSILLRQDFNPIMKLALIGWASILSISPAKLKLYLAQKVCNPLSA